MIVITKIIVIPAMTGTMIYVTGRLWLLSLFDSGCGEEREVDGLVVFTIVFVGKDIAVDRGVDVAVDRGVDQGVDRAVDRGVDRGVDIVRVLSTKNKDDSYSI